MENAFVNFWESHEKDYQQISLSIMILDFYMFLPDETFLFPLSMCNF